MRINGNCTVFPGKRHDDWDLIDPVGRPIDVVRRIRDGIRTRVEDLIAGLGGGSDQQAAD